MQLPRRALRAFLACALAAGACAAAAPAAGANDGTKDLDWRPCGDRFQCAELEVPLDYSRPHWRTIEIPILKLPATDPSRRIGAGVGGAGGPGQSGIDLLREGRDFFAPLNERFDLVAFEQRGVAIDCGPTPDPDPDLAEPHDVDVGELARRSREIGRLCLQRNPTLLPYVTTANAARDMDRLRAALGEKRLTYIGGSYGTILGSTYSTLFPGRVRAMALDGPVDDVWMSRPLEATREQVMSFEASLDRFAMLCAGSSSCGFGGHDPEAAIDALVARLDRSPLPVPGRPGVTIDGQKVLIGLAELMYVPSLWPATAAMLAQLEQGVTDLASELIGIDLFGVNYDAFWAITAADGNYPRGIAPYLSAVRHTWGAADHFWFVGGYNEARHGFWPVEGRGAYRGPMRAYGASVKPLVIAVKHDPATPYRWGQRLARDLDGHLLTVNGDSHTSLPNPCVLRATKRYVEDLVLPAEDETCTQPNPFRAATAAAATSRSDLRRQIRRARRSTTLGMPLPALIGR